MKNIYILLSRSTTMLSTVIKLCTKENYTHSSVAFDENLETMCSFGRKYPKLPFPGGLISEHLLKGYFVLHPKTPCMLLSLSVDDESYEKAKQQAEEMLKKRGDYHYNVLGLVYCKLGKYKKRETFYFCSEFVAEILKNIDTVDLPFEPGLMHPQNFAQIHGVSIKYEGTVGELAECLYEYKFGKSRLQTITDRFVNDIRMCLRKFRFL